MVSVTYYVALPFIRDKDGSLIASEAKDCHSSRQAIAMAQAFAKQNPGAIAFSRTGNPSVGEFDPAVVIAKFGDVPDDLSEF